MKRIPYIDFARGYAILTIVMFHLLQQAGLNGMMQQAIVFGGSGVHLFFLLSGFGLALSPKVIPAAVFYRRRFTKVWLPYVLALTVSLAFAWGFGFFSDGLPAWFAGVFLYQMFFERWVQSFGGHFWFISAIVQFYLVYPLLARIFNSGLKTGWFAAGALVLSIAWWMVVFAWDKGHMRTWNGFFLQFFWEFCLGMVLAVRFRAVAGQSAGERSVRLLRPDFWNHPTWVAVLAGLVGTAVMVVLVARLGSVGKIFNDVPALIGYTAWSVVVFRLGTYYWKPIRQFFEWVGTFSYSLYLVHILVLTAYLRLLDMVGVQPGVVSLLPVVPLALLAGWMFEPLSRRWVALFEAPAGPVVPPVKTEQEAVR